MKWPRAVQCFLLMSWENVFFLGGGIMQVFCIVETAPRKVCSLCAGFVEISLFELRGTDCNFGRVCFELPPGVRFLFSSSDCEETFKFNQFARAGRRNHPHWVQPNFLFVCFQSFLLVCHASSRHNPKIGENQKWKFSFFSRK